MRVNAARVDDEALDLIAAAEAAACGIDRHHRVVYWNDAAAALLGWTSREALGASCYELFAGRDVFGNRCCFRDCGVAVASARGEVALPFVMDVRKADGAPRRVVTRTIALPAPGAAYTCLVHLFEEGNGPALAAIVSRVTAIVAERPAPPAGPASERHASVALTRREREVLHYIAQGYGSENVAARLGLSHATVRNQIQSLLRRLDAHSRLEAVSVAYRLGLLGPEEGGGDGRIRTDE